MAKAQIQDFGYTAMKVDRFFTIIDELRAIPVEERDYEHFVSICNVVCAKLGIIFFGLFEIDAIQNLAIFRAGSGQIGQFLVERGHRIDLQSKSFKAKCIVNNQIVLLDQKKDELLYTSSLPSVQQLKKTKSLELNREDYDLHRLPSPLLPIEPWHIALPLRNEEDSRMGACLGFCEIDEEKNVLIEEVIQLQQFVDELTVYLIENGFGKDVWQATT